MSHLSSPEQEDRILTPNPTRVAIDELQLQLLQKAEAAVPPMNSMNPEIKLEPIPPAMPSRGKESKAPMIVALDFATTLCRRLYD